MAGVFEIDGIDGVGGPAPADTDILDDNEYGYVADVSFWSQLFWVERAGNGYGISQSQTNACSERQNVYPIEVKNMSIAVASRCVNIRRKINIEYNIQYVILRGVNYWLGIFSNIAGPNHIATTQLIIRRWPGSRNTEP